jgi:hypothetical protein
MIAWHRHDGPVPTSWWHSERIVVSLHDEYRHPHRLEFGQSTLGRVIDTAGRMNRKRQAQHRHRVHLGCGAAGDTGACGAASDHEGNITEGVIAQLRENRQPGGIELPGGGG